MSNAILKCEGLTKTYVDGKQKVKVLKGIDFEVNQSELISIMGSSGSGKSTFLHLLGGLDKPTTGVVTIGGESISNLSDKKLCQLRNQHLGFIYQFHHLLPEFNALENVSMPLLIGGTSPASAKEMSRDILTKVGLGDRLSHRIGELSGGERQRCAIARALVTKPKCVLADEPTGNLDDRTAQEVFDLMLELQKQLGTSFVIVTHDPDLASKCQTQRQVKDGLLV